MSVSLIKYLAVALALVAIIVSVDSCGSHDANKLLKENYAKLERESKTRVIALEDSVSVLRKKNDSLLIVEDSIKTYRDTVRIYLKEQGDQTRSYSEEQADSVLNSRFANRKENLEYVVESDSVKFEYHSLVSLNKITNQKLRNEQVINSFKSGIIQEKDIQLGVKDDVIEFCSMELRDEKRKKPMVFIKGVGVGIGVTAAILLFTQ